MSKASYTAEPAPPPPPSSLPPSQPPTPPPLRLDTLELIDVEAPPIASAGTLYEDAWIAANVRIPLEPSSPTAAAAAESSLPEAAGNRPTNAYGKLKFGGTKPTAKARHIHY